MALRLTAVRRQLQQLAKAPFSSAKKHVNKQVRSLVTSSTSGAQSTALVSEVRKIPSDITFAGGFVARNSLLSARAETRPKTRLIHQQSPLIQEFGVEKVSAGSGHRAFNQAGEGTRRTSPEGNGASGWEILKVASYTGRRFTTVW